MALNPCVPDFGHSFAAPASNLRPQGNASASIASIALRCLSEGDKPIRKFRVSSFHEGIQRKVAQNPAISDQQYAGVWGMICGIVEWCWQSCRALFDATPASILKAVAACPSPATLENAKPLPPGRFVREAGALGRWQPAAGPFFHSDSACGRLRRPREMPPAGRARECDRSVKVGLGSGGRTGALADHRLSEKIVLGLAPRRR